MNRKVAKFVLVLALVFLVGVSLIACQKITPNAPELDSIALTGYTAQFEKGVDFSTGSIVVTAKYSDGTTKAIPIADCTVDSAEYDKTTVGTYSIKVTYQGKEATYEVSVVNPAVTYTLTVVGGTGGGTYAEGTRVTAVATVPAGKRFVKWTVEGQSVGTTSSFSFALTADTTITANFVQQYTVTVVGGTIDGAASKTVDENAEVTVIPTVPAKKGFVNWTVGGQSVSTASSYTFNVTADTTITANFQDVVTSEHWKRINADNTDNYTGNYILFGSYPQTSVSDATTTEALNNLVGDLPTGSTSATWTSYDYSSNTSNNIMWYIDKEYDGAKYRGVYIVALRPNIIGSSSSKTNSYHDENGYAVSNVYWFKYEPLKWRILSENGGKALIYCDYAIDSREFYTSSVPDQTTGGETKNPNAWEYSTIRAWLNDTFYETAFTTAQQALIELTALDNKTTSGIEDNEFATVQNNTEDKIFLLSYKDMLNANYGFREVKYADAARINKATDYAKWQGVFAETTKADYLGNTSVLLRTAGNRNNNVEYVNYTGAANNNGMEVTQTIYGIAPALVIKLY